MKNALKEAFNVIIEKRVEGEAFAKVSKLLRNAKLKNALKKRCLNEMFF